MTRMLPAADCASRNRLACVVEWSMSSPSMPFESKKAVPASSKETPCLVLLLVAFFESHSNTNYVYTKLELCASWFTSGEPVSGRVPPPSRRFLSEKQGPPSSRAAKQGQPTLDHAAQSEKTPDPFVLPLNRRLRRRRNPVSDAADGACNGAYCPPGSFCRMAPGVSGMETLSGGGKMNRMSEAIA